MPQLIDEISDKQRKRKLKEIREKSLTMRSSIFIGCRATSEEKLAVLDYMERHKYASQSDLIREALNQMGCFDVLLADEDE